MLPLLLSPLVSLLWRRLIERSGRLSESRLAILFSITVLRENEGTWKEPGAKEAREELGSLLEEVWLEHFAYPARRLDLIGSGQCPRMTGKQERDPPRGPFESRGGHRWPTGASLGLPTMYVRLGEEV
jgi:hypothetical protein